MRFLSVFDAYGAPKDAYSASNSPFCASHHSQYGIKNAFAAYVDAFIAFFGNEMGKEALKHQN